MPGRASKVIFLAIVFFLSSQVGFHFWPSFSYINGIRIDYLSPTLYLMDILIMGWIVLYSKRVISGIRDMRAIGVIKILLGLLLLDLLWNVFAAKSPGAHIFGLIKLVELGLFGWLVAKNFKLDWIAPFIRVLSFSALISFILALWQLVIKGSVGGLWYYFGERTFGISTIGISTVNFDQQILRPYAAFPHPNLLAFFFLATCVFTLKRVQYEQGLWRYFLTLITLICIIGVFLTFSRISILLLLTFLFYEIYSKTKSKFKYFALGLLQILVPFFLISFYANISVYLFRGIDFRQELLVQSWQIFQKSPYFGIGLNNFFTWQEPLIKTISPINFQPPHNIYIVALLSLGLFGWWIVPYGFFVATKSVWQKIYESRIMNYESRDFYQSVLFVLIGIIIVGLFDHFLLTLEQGQVILALISGLAFVNLKVSKVSKAINRRSNS